MKSSGGDTYLLHTHKALESEEEKEAVAGLNDLFFSLSLSLLRLWSIANLPVWNIQFEKGGGGKVNGSERRTKIGEAPSDIPGVADAADAFSTSTGLQFPPKIIAAQFPPLPPPRV